MLALQQAAAAVGSAPDLRIFVYFSIAVFACIYIDVVGATSI